MSFTISKFIIVTPLIKKAIHISLVLILLVSTIGVTIYRHYCCGILISKSVGFPAKKCCNDNCKDCKNDHKTFKITDNYKAGTFKPDFRADVKKLFNNFSVSFVLLHINTTPYNNNLITTIKICDTRILTPENPTSVLQVFRL